MKDVRCHIIFSLFILFCLPVWASDDDRQDVLNADNIIKEVIRRAELYGSYINEYEADIYVRGTSHVLKRNILSLYAPDIFFVNKKNDQSILEAIAKVHYKAPNIFSQEIMAISGNKMDIRDVQSRVMRFMNVNIYNRTSFNNDEVLMPVSPKAFDYYRFSYLSDGDTLGMKVVTIKVEPKTNSQKLISGTISVVLDLWVVSNMDISGKWGFTSFRVCTGFDISGKEFLLPKHTNLSFQMKLLGNHVENHYVSTIQYSRINKKDDLEQNRLGYDLTDYFEVKLDTLPVEKDSSFWNKNRPIPLTPSEEKIYRNNNKQTKQLEDELFHNKNKSWNVTKGIFSARNFDFAQHEFRYSGILNPVNLTYSKLDGLVYWQQLKLYHTFESGQAVSFDPSIGLTFENSGIFFKLPVNWVYRPRRMGRFGLSLEKGNNSLSSRWIERVNEMLKDKWDIDFNELGLKYYRHYNLSLRNEYELFNGFLFNAGVSCLFYRPVQSEPESQDEVFVEFEDYKSFTPVVGFTYTPGQYYRIINKRKEYIGSHFPTFSVEYARGIPDVLKSSSDYERIEADMQQRISLGLSHSLRYYVGGGIFMNTSSIYFADFVKFSKRNFPQSWDDPMGGVFYLFDSKWYNASNTYLQAHLMYETPFILSRLIKKIGNEVFQERIYWGQLYLPAMPSYTEVGYSIGNYIFSAGVFAGFERKEYKGIGFKFEFEIGK